MFLISSAFFGLDQVGVMLESPFGVDPADISLLTLGTELSNDLDAILRTARNEANANIPVMKKQRADAAETLDGAAKAALTVDKTVATLDELASLIEKLEGAIKQAKSSTIPGWKLEVAEAACKALRQSAAARYKRQLIGAQCTATGNTLKGALKKKKKKKKKEEEVDEEDEDVDDDEEGEDADGGDDGGDIGCDDGGGDDGGQ